MCCFYVVKVSVQNLLMDGGSKKTQEADDLARKAGENDCADPIDNGSPKRESKGEHLKGQVLHHVMA